MKTLTLGTALFASLITLAAAQAPAEAASPITNGFLANVQANVDFLEAAGTLALDRSKSDTIRTYASEQKANAARLGTEIDAALPADTAQGTAKDADALMTGRSVAIDGVTSNPGQAANGRLPLGARDLAALGKLSGKKFDDAFWLKQLDALSQLRADFRAYADDGDDAALSALAERELPAVERRLAALSQI